MIRNGWDDLHIKKVLGVPLKAIRQVRREIRLTSAAQSETEQGPASLHLLAA